MYSELLYFPKRRDATNGCNFRLNYFLFMISQFCMFFYRMFDKMRLIKSYWLVTCRLFHHFLGGNRSILLLLDISMMQRNCMAKPCLSNDDKFKRCTFSYHLLMIQHLAWYLAYLLFWSYTLFKNCYGCFGIVSVRVWVVIRL